MSYISINRYWGDESEQDQSKSSDALQNLLSKVEERRKKRKTLNLNKEDDVSISIENTEKHICPADEAAVENETVIEPAAGEENLTNVDTSCNFTIIKSLEFKKLQKVKRVLPSWLSKPSIVSVDLKNLNISVSDIPEVDASLVAELKKNKITHFFPVQSQLIPWILKFHSKCRRFWPRDVCVSAPTGSGKTLSFVLPIIQLLKSRMICCVRALVVLPTKDLSVQVFRVFKQYGVGTDLKIVHLGNGTLEKEKHKIVVEDEIHGYRSLVDIIVTSPGRLVEHLKYTKGLSFCNLRFLVIDEADHVMDSVQNDWLKHLQTRIPPFGLNSEVPYLTLSNITERPARTQKLLFSATLSQDPEKLKQLNLFQPRLFTSVVKSKDGEDIAANVGGQTSTEFIGKYATPAELEERYTICPLSVKPLVLYHIMKENKWKRILCFADSVSNVHKLTTLLRQLNSLDEGTEKLNIMEISSKLNADVHREILEKFSKNKIDILVTTDALARGIDLQNVEYVVLYDAPKFMKNYVHRIGRTGRAGNKGTSLVLVTPDQTEHFKEIFNMAGKSDVKELAVDINDLRDLEAVYKDALQALRTDMETERMEEKKNVQVSNKRKRKRR